MSDAAICEHASSTEILGRRHCDACGYIMPDDKLGLPGCEPPPDEDDAED